MTRKPAWTLIELLTAITIMGFLVAAAAVSLTNARIQSRDAKRAADLSTIANALAEHERLRRGQPVITTGSSFRRCVSTLADLNPYFQNGSAPVDPLPGGGSCPSVGGGYVYHQFNTGESDNLATQLEVTYALLAGFERAPQAEISTLRRSPGTYTAPNRTVYHLAGPAR